MKFKGDIRGIEDMRGKLLSLNAKFAKQAVSRALRAAAKIFQAELIERAPVRTGATRDNIKVRAGKRSRNKIRMNVLIAGQALFKGAIYYAGMVLLGWLTGKRKSKNRRHVEGTFWAHHGWKAKEEAAVEAMKETLAKELKQYEGKGL